jgi:hypothetical protein
MRFHWGGTLLPFISLYLFIGGIGQDSLGVEIPKECLQSLKNAEAALQNAEFKYSRASSPGQSDGVSGFMRLRGEMIQSEYQYDGDDRLVFVWRPDASFRLGEVDKAWAPRGLHPGASTRDTGGPDFPLRHLLFGGASLVDVLQNDADSPYETLSFRKQATNEWNATIARKNPKDKNTNERWVLTLDESQQWLPVQLSPPNAKALIKYEYGTSLHGVPFLSHIRVYEDNVLTSESKIELISSKAPANSFFRLDHYGLSENLLKPIDRGGLSGWIWPVGFVLLGAILIGLSMYLRR